MNDNQYTSGIPGSCSGIGWLVVSEPIMSRDEIIRVIESTADENYEEIHVSDDLLISVHLKQPDDQHKMAYVQMDDDCIGVFDYEIDGLIRALQKAKAMLGE